MKVTAFRLSVIVLFISLMTSCYNGRERYYADHGDWDDVRLPLIKPYAAFCLNGQNDWGVQIEDSEDSSRYFCAPNVQKINIVHHMVFLQAGKTIVNHANASQGWFLLIPHKKLEIGFLSHSAYLRCLDSLQIKEPRLYNIEDIAHYQGKHDTIDWQDINLHTSL